MMTYLVQVQFADPSAPDFDCAGIMEVIDQAIEYYNSRSRIARNPKMITGRAIVDPRTLQLELESRSELLFPSKALHLFSAYLVDPFQEFIYGKQLFKMFSRGGGIDKPHYEVSTDALRIKAISLIMGASREKVVRILDIFEEEEFKDEK